MVDFSRERTQRRVARIADCVDDLEIGIGCAGGCEALSAEEEAAYFLANYDEDRYDLAENMERWQARRRYTIVGAAAFVATAAMAALVWVVVR